MGGDHALFNAEEGIERLWQVSIPLLEAPPPVRLHTPGSWGPKSIHQLIAPHAWRLPVWRAAWFYAFREFALAQQCERLDATQRCHSSQRVSEGAQRSRRETRSEADHYQ
jgi:hypothetical protein